MFLLIPKDALPVSLLDSSSQHLPLSSESGYGGNLLIVSPGRHRTIPRTGCGSVFARQPILNLNLSPGAKLKLTIDDIAFGGEGVGRVDDFVVFVPFVAPGETVEVELTEVKKRFARARLLRVLQPSPERAAPACPYFGECGGCQYQHLDYPAQLRIKHKQIADLFQRIGGFDGALIDPVTPCPQPYGYRNRIMIRSQWDKFKQGLNIGFIRADNRLVVDIQECKIAEPALSAANPGGPPPSSAQRRPQGGAARRGRRLGRPARFVFSKQFLSPAQAGGNGPGTVARRRDALLD